MKSKSLAPRLAAAVLAAGVLVSSAGVAQASTNVATVSAAKSSAATKQEMYNFAKSLGEAKTAGQMATVLKASSADLSDLITPLSAVPASTTVGATPSGVDSLGPSAQDIIDVIVNRLNPAADASCPESPMNAWVADQIIPAPMPENPTPEQKDAWGREMAGTIIALQFGSLVPTYQAVWNGPDDKTLTRFGEEQDKTKVVTQSIKKLKNFWSDVKTGPITVSAMKDDILTGRTQKDLLNMGVYMSVAAETIAPTPGAKHLDPRKASEWPADAKKAMRALSLILTNAFAAAPKTDGGENPVFTMNAFAMMPEPGFETESGLPKRFVFGDGLLTYLRVAKYSDVAIEGIIGHEFGHHIQFVLGTDYPEATVPEQTRHSELEADAYAGYYGAHKLGLNLNKAGRAETQRIFFDTGDCDVKSDGHHGTPAQRQASVAWAQQLADTQKKNGHVFAAESVRLKFNTQLPTLLTAK